jgi:polygalacturonase
MKFQIISINTRSIVIEIVTTDIFETNEYCIYLNSNLIMKSKNVIQTIDKLKPHTTYEIELKSENSNSEIISFQTKFEFVTLNVKEFGAKGDGNCDDTSFIQCAINACPLDGRVYIPKGTYKVTNLFLKSDITIQFDNGAVLSAINDRDQFAILPGLIESYDEKDEYNLGSWEGNPLDCFAGIITGINVSNILICGDGIIDGNASLDTWWKEPKKKIKAFRPRLIYLNHCENVTIQDITLTNSPSWNLHPYFSNHLRFINLHIINPKDSPNTDGINPESCKDVEIIGTYFSLGDDCIAIKSGKIYMGKKYKTPSEDIRIHQCFMEHGHGSITIGSEMAGGVRNIVVSSCLFSNTDRGLRIKTRRGRGEDGIIDNITFDHIRMNHVLTPIVINSFYYCDPDGHSNYVKTKEILPVDERTPSVRNLFFQDIECINCHVAASYMYGLPEMKIKKVVMNHVIFSFSDKPRSGIPDMLDDVEAMICGGLIAYNIEELELKDVVIRGCLGSKLVSENIDILKLDSISQDLLL